MESIFQALMFLDLYGMAPRYSTLIIQQMISTATRWLISGVLFSSYSMLKLSSPAALCVQLVCSTAVSLIRAARICSCK